MSKFYISFLARCSEKGYTTEDQIKGYVESLVSKIDKKVAEVEKMKIYRQKLSEFLKVLTSRESYVEVEDACDNEFFKDLKYKIITLVEQNDKITPTQLISKLVPLESHSIVYSVIKDLLKDNILIREESFLMRGTLHANKEIEGEGSNGSGVEEGSIQDDMWGDSGGY